MHGNARDAVKRRWNALGSSGTLRFETRSHQPQSVRGTLDLKTLGLSAMPLGYAGTLSGSLGRANVPQAFANHFSFKPRLSW